MHVIVDCKVSRECNRYDIAVVGELDTTIYKSCTINGARWEAHNLHEVRRKLLQWARGDETCPLIVVCDREHDEYLNVPASRVVVLAMYPRVVGEPITRPASGAA